MKRIVQLVLLALLLPALCHSEENRQHLVEQAQSVIAPLSPELQQLFSREMLELQNGMLALVPLYVAGKLDDIVTIAARMENSYVLKQNMTGSQMHELHEKLPAAFLKQDQQFHYLAGMLEHVANAGKIELVGFYISKMLETCVACHATYAANRFPALSHKSQSERDH